MAYCCRDFNCKSTKGTFSELLGSVMTAEPADGTVMDYFSKVQIEAEF